MNRYDKNIVLKDQKASKYQLQDGSKIWRAKTAATTSTAKREILQILKQGSTVHKEYLLKTPVCAIVGGLARSSTKERFKIVGHAVVIVIHVGERGLEITQMDP